MGRLSTEEFIRRACEMHGDKYDYSKSAYTGWTDKVTITCVEHGKFSQRASSHLRGDEGCKGCKKRRRRPDALTTEEFIHRARKTHGDKYDYCQTVYSSSLVKVSIICPDHGEFMQLPYNHWKGHNCPECAKLSKSLTRDQFIGRAREVYGDKYEYPSLGDYVPYKNKIKIICPEHGVFRKWMGDHLTAGAGCQECAGVVRRTPRQFVKKAREVHGRKYDYSQAGFTLGSRPVTLICPEHGEFTQQAQEHLRGHGCPVCARRTMGDHLRLNTREFITRARKTHGRKYDYSRTEYTCSRDPVAIICRKHGEFTQQAASHIKGNGCPKCKHDALRLTTEEFIKRARKTHRRKYDYSKVQYSCADDPVVIVCPDHGEFKQKPGQHIFGHGCPRCSPAARRTTEEFVALAREVHGDRYDYAHTQYTGASKKLAIICPEHGEFQQEPTVHLRGSGCRQCNPPPVRLTTEEFIAKAREVHGNRYDYSKTVYTRTIDPVTIICPVHGKFEQRAASHLRGSGCQQCGKRRGKNEKLGLE